MKQIAMPHEALEAGANKIAQAVYGAPLAHLRPKTQDMLRNALAAAFTAMVSAWPGMDTMPFGDGMPRIRLPLQESSDG